MAEQPTGAFSGKDRAMSREQLEARIVFLERELVQTGAAFDVPAVLCAQDQARKDHPNMDLGNGKVLRRSKGTHYPGSVVPGGGPVEHEWEVELGLRNGQSTNEELISYRVWRDANNHWFAQRIETTE